jgi:hypothetical protein
MLKIMLYKNETTRLYWGIMISIARNRKRSTIEEQGVVTTRKEVVRKQSEVLVSLEISKREQED